MSHTLLMPRTLLPVFNKYALSKGLDIQEEPETFNWMKKQDQYDLEMAKAALDNLPGSREWLKDYTFVEGESAHPFCNGFGPRLLSDFGIHHSGASATRLAWNYKGILNNWNGFVYMVKHSYLKDEYKARQLTKTDIATYGKSIQGMKEAFKLPYDDDTTRAMLSDLEAEILAEEWARMDKAKADKLAARINVLKHHYAFPDRWFDGPGGSALAGSPDDISSEVMTEMTKIYSDYPSHIKLVLEAFKVHVLYHTNCKDLTPSEAAELDAYASIAKSRLFDPPKLVESFKLTKASLDKIATSRASYLTRVIW